MKFALPWFFLFTITVSVSTFSISAMAQGSFALGTLTIKNNQKAKPQLRVNSSKQAAQMAQGRFGGKVLKVQKRNEGYRVKLIKSDGNIVSVYVDAKSGQISGGN